ncbi:MAG: class I SAM-dependent methyltransferase [Thermoanaerobaculia bacterium]
MSRLTLVTSRHRWRFDEVSDIGGAASSLRNYLEQSGVRRCLETAARERPIRAAADVGCGYGRLTPVLTEFAPRVAGFEREETLLAEARRLQPGVEWISVKDLASLPAPDGAFDFAMTFTVLQHIPDAAACQVVAELQRVARGGFLLLVEETDPALGAELPRDVPGGTRGRPVETWEQWLAPWRLRLAFPRSIEPGYPRADVGTFLLFGS